MAQGDSLARQTTRWAWLWGAIIVFYAILAFGSDGQILKYLYFEPNSVGDLGASFERAPQAEAPVVIAHLRPGSVLAAAGVQEGDRLRLDYPWDDLRIPKAGERFGFTKLSVRGETHVSVTAPAATPPPEMDKLYMALTPIGNLAMTLAGMFIAWRARGDFNTILLGTAFVFVGPVPPVLWPIPPTHFPFWDVPIMPAIALLPWLFLKFAMGYFEKTAGRIRKWEKIAFWMLLSLQCACAIYEMMDTLLDLGLPAIGFIRPLNFLLQIVGLALPVYYLALGWWRSAAETRKRYTIMLIALPMCFLSQSIYVLVVMFGFFKVDLKSPLIVAAALGLFTGPVLFAYAVLRHKILDLGFVINRTLVYGIVSAIMLVAFGLIEWAVEHLANIEGRETNAFIDAGIALGVFLTFHRVRNFVEGVVERVLFRTWHEKEEAIKRFVREARFITKPEALMRAFVAELTKFGDGAPAAIYVRDEGGVYRRAEGAIASAPEIIDVDDPTLVSLRAAPRPIELDGSALPAALALPMVNRNDVIGVAFLGLKPLGSAYRPDESEALGQAAIQIGLDLHALKVEALETRVSALETRNSELHKALGNAALA